MFWFYSSSNWFLGGESYKHSLPSGDASCNLHVCAGELPGAVYGRMRDCVYVTQSAYVAPVATALRCGVNLASTLVTENRAAAVACLDYVTKAKAGCLKCLIVEEHRAKAAAHVQHAELLHACLLYTSPSPRD